MPRSEGGRIAQVMERWLLRCGMLLTVRHTVAACQSFFYENFSNLCSKARLDGWTSISRAMVSDESVSSETKTGLGFSHLVIF
jgi:hypothetical protein